MFPNSKATKVQHTQKEMVQKFQLQSNHNLYNILSNYNFEIVSHLKMC